MVNWGNLPNDVLQSIFDLFGTRERLDSILTVCHAWSKMATCHEIYFSLTLRSCQTAWSRLKKTNVTRNLCCNYIKHRSDVRQLAALLPALQHLECGVLAEPLDGWKLPVKGRVRNNILMPLMACEQLLELKLHINSDEAPRIPSLPALTSLTVFGTSYDILKIWFSKMPELRNFGKVDKKTKTKKREWEWERE